MWRIILKVGLSFAIYLLSVWVISGSLNAFTYLMARISSPELWITLHKHFLAKSIAVGFLAGLIPLQFLFSVSGYFRSDIPEFFSKLQLEKMKKWIVVLASPIAVIVLMEWIHDWIAIQSKTVTVLQEGSSIHLAQMFVGFFSDSCTNVSDIRIDLWGDNFAYECKVHIIQLSTFFTAAAYSLAPWAREHFPNSAATDNSGSVEHPLADEKAQESMNEDERIQ